MDKKKILIVSRAFYPIIAPRAFRATELAKEFARQGHNVTVLTHKRDFNYNEFSKQYGLTIKDFVNGSWHDFPAKDSLFLKIFRKLLNYFFIYPDIQLTPLLIKALKEEYGYHLIISIAVPYPVHWGVAIAKRKNKQLAEVWIADCGDPFMGNKESKLIYPFYFRLIENWFCKKPDFLTVPISEAIQAYPLSCQHKIKVIPQGFQFDVLKSPTCIVKGPYPIFAYAGALSKGVRDPSQLLDYLCTLTNREFKFIIYTQSLSVVASYSNKLGDKFEIRDYVPREQLLSELGMVDFLVNIENRDNVQSPSKLIDYAITQKPILSINPNVLNETVVSEFLDGDYSNKLVIENIEQYNIENVAQQFINLLNINSET